MTLHFPWSDFPGPDQAIDIAPGVRWLSMPLPFALKQVNLWLLDDTDQSLLIDTGAATSESQHRLNAQLHQLARPLQRVLVTHYHPDHIGLAGWLEQRFGTQTLMSAVEWARAQAAINLSDAEFTRLEADVFRSHGLDEHRLASLVTHGNSYLPLVDSLPQHVETAGHGEQLMIDEQAWEIITVGGHSPDMICLYNASLNLLVAADQILPHITPNISLSFYATEHDPLGTFLDSFSRFAHLPEDVLVLPSHGLPFRGLRERAQQLIEHHHQRFDTLRDLCKSPQTAASALPALFQRSLDSGQLMFAMGESIAHLRYLELRGELIRHDQNGVYHYTRS